MRVNHTNCLATTHPHLLAEWHPSKNENINPYKITKGSKKKACWICPDCKNEYYASILSRAGSKTGCPLCSGSKGEKRIANFLKNHNIPFIAQYKINECCDKLPLPFDFAIFDANEKLKLLIEYDGKHHYMVNDFFGGIKSFKQLKIHDDIKTNFCIENDICLLRIPYWEHKNIEKVLYQTLLKKE